MNFILGLVEWAEAQHRWRDLTAGAYLGHIERATDELERAERQLQAATTKRDNAAQRLQAQQERAAAMEESGEIVPL